MASDTVHTAEILVDDLSTKSVTFAPVRATVVREIQDVRIKPGPNEITIYGLDANVDLDSIRVEGHGPATITDIQTEIVRHRRRFEDVYPSESDDESSDSEDPDNDYGVDKAALDETQQELRESQYALARAKNEQSAALTSLEFLDHYGRSMDARHVEVSKVDEFLTLYLQHRGKLGDSHQQSNSDIAELDRRIGDLTRKTDHLKDAFEAAKNKASKEFRRAREKKSRENEERRQKKQRELNEKRRFWPWNVGQVVLHLDGLGSLTPGSSRRSSIVAGKKPDIADSEDGLEATVNLLLTYVTPNATWYPRYELSINSPSSSGKVVYRAEFQNFSSETWRDSKLILSTSQASFSSLDERLPVLQAWHIKLGKADEALAGQKKNAPWSGGLENKMEVTARMNYGMKQVAPNKPYQNTNSNNSNLFGSLPQQPPLQQQLHRQRQQAQVQAQQAQAQQMQQAQAQQMQQSQALFGQPGQPRIGGLFGNGVSSAAPVSTGSALFGSSSSQPAASSFGGFGSGTRPTVHADESIGGASAHLADEDEDSADIDTETLTPSNLLAYQEVAREEYGLTTSYDLPGHRTLAPSSLKRRHVIAELELKSITLSHVLVPKLRPAAFLRARIKNTSNVALLRGKAGLTLDGTFLGSTTLPSCSPDDSFSLSLGIDPSILVNYAKPTVRRSTTGFFNKEDSAVFTRVCWIKNTKNASVSVFVSDQVPQSEDDRLRISILEPRGLEKEGDKTKLDPGKGGAWGKGVASMGKNGEVRWELTLEKGKDVKVVLEYEARIPSGQKMIGLD